MDLPPFFFFFPPFFLFLFSSFVYDPSCSFHHLIVSPANWPILGWLVFALTRPKNPRCVGAWQPLKCCIGVIRTSSNRPNFLLGPLVTRPSPSPRASPISKLERLLSSPSTLPIITIYLSWQRETRKTEEARQTWN
ncbi:hypothetical protein LX32DRAFT_335708 [Colletotrichum zoysiae]|uniref:Secreted protein n=1 Tax=Colletotrichum zoysiae TaxID=1216348 RepID=A0AAD9HKR3_9PEZI|nr:hypothetical protein LX32DRAFT_335708 [Colletotrichum zoysiae]